VLADPGSAGAVYIDVTDPQRAAAGAGGDGQSTANAGSTGAGSSTSSAGSGTTSAGTSTDGTGTSGVAPTATTGG
jgi:hypothetical protein